MRYLSVFQGLQALPPSIHAESAVKHTPLTVKHTRPAVKHSRPAVKHSRLAVKHSAPAVKHTGAPVEHSPPAAEHSTAAVEHTRQAIERSRATGRQRVLAFKQREPALKQTPQSIQHRRNPRWSEAASQPSEAFKSLQLLTELTLIKENPTMDTKITNRVTMYKTVSSYLDEHSSVWNTMAPLQTALTQFKAEIAGIDTTAQQKEAPSGATDDKAEAREALEDVLFLACEALGVVAHTSNDHDLAALTDVTRTGLDRMAAEELSNRAASVLAQANVHKTSLVPLQVTQDNLDEFEQALQEFNAVKTGPRAAIVARATQTESLSTRVRRTNGILRNQIDRMVSLFNRSNPDFVSGYQSARVIVDRAASHSTRPTAPPPA